MLDNKGGRGIKAKYPTKTIRLPEILEELVAKLITAIYSGIDLQTLQKRLNLDLPEVTNEQLTLLLPSSQDLIDKANEILKQKKSARQSLEKFLQVIYSDNSLKL